MRAGLASQGGGELANHIMRCIFWEAHVGENLGCFSSGLAQTKQTLSKKASRQVFGLGGCL